MASYDTEDVLAALAPSPRVAHPGPTPAEEELTDSKLQTPTVSAVFCGMVRHPIRHLFRRWNWKSAVLSSLLRATIFFFTNLVAGWHAALGAMLAELVFRSVTSGF